LEKGGKVGNALNDAQIARDPVPGRDMDPEIVAFVDHRYGGTPLGKTATAR
jgi:hypothetical protein